jgi:ketosteroid isomerase-like protein
VKTGPFILPFIPLWERGVSNEDVVVEFQINEEEIKLTQVGTDTAGHEIAIRTTICADGQEHPAPFGEGVRLKTFWTTSLRLDATLTTSDRTISRCSYEVSADGKSLSFPQQKTEFSSSGYKRMRHSPGLPAAIALVVVTPMTLTSCTSPLKPGGPMQSQNKLEADIRSIEALNQHDLNAEMAGDTDAIISQWTDDFVLIQAGSPITRGRSANAAAVEQGKDQMKDFKPIDVNLDAQEIIVAGDYAFEWGTYRGSVRSVTSGETVSYVGKFMRILQRQPDGSWKMHRTMVGTDAQPR